MRLVGLGAIMFNPAALGLTGPIFGSGLAGYDPGFPAIFGGAMLCIIVIRIGRPALYADWMASGLLYISLGSLLSSHAAPASALAFALFCALFLASALLRIWTAATLRAADGGLMAGGVTGLCCAAWLAITQLAGAPADPDIVLSADVMLHGIAIAGFGLFLGRKAA